MTKRSNPRILVLEGLAGASERVWQAGGTPVTVSPYSAKAVERLFQRSRFGDDLDGVLLTGGGDVDPRRYGVRPHKSVYGVSEDRDNVEFAVVQWALTEGVPLLGICRGNQVLNVAAGGTLVQDLPRHKRTYTDKRGVDFTASYDDHHGTHYVLTVAGTLVAQALGCLDLPVVHLHHQAVRRVGRGFRATAWADDGTVEAIESTGGVWQVGVQFHPEMAPAADPENGLFRQLVVAACQRARLSVVPATRRRPKSKPKTTTTRVPTTVGHTRGAVVTPTELDDQAEHEQRAVDLAIAFHGATTPGGPGVDFFRCYRCREWTDFDLRDDYVDHMSEVHHAVVLANREV